jgi:hypothetical protein
MHDTKSQNRKPQTRKRFTIDLDRSIRWTRQGAMDECPETLNRAATFADVPRAELVEWLANPSRMLCPPKRARVARVLNILVFARQTQAILSETDPGAFEQLVLCEAVDRAMESNHNARAEQEAVERSDSLPIDEIRNGQTDVEPPTNRRPQLKKVNKR